MGEMKRRAQAPSAITVSAVSARIARDEGRGDPLMRPFPLLWWSIPRYALMKRWIRAWSTSSKASIRVHAVRAMRVFMPGYGARITWSRCCDTMARSLSNRSGPPPPGPSPPPLEPEIPHHPRHDDRPGDADDPAALPPPGARGPREPVSGLRLVRRHPCSLLGVRVAGAGGSR